MGNKRDENTDFVEYLFFSITRIDKNITLNIFFGREKKREAITTDWKPQGHLKCQIPQTSILLTSHVFIKILFLLHIIRFQENNLIFYVCPDHWMERKRSVGDKIPLTEKEKEYRIEIWTSRDSRTYRNSSSMIRRLQDHHEDNYTLNTKN